MFSFKNYLKESDQHLLLKAIDDDPKEWTGWLAYADYLDETNEPLNAKKADLIRKRYAIWQADQNLRSYRRMSGIDNYYTSMEYDKEHHKLNTELDDKEHEYRLAHTELGGTLPDRSEPHWRKVYQPHKRPESDVSHMGSLLTYNIPGGFAEDMGVFIMDGIGPHLWMEWASRLHADGLGKQPKHYNWFVRFDYGKPIKIHDLHAHGNHWESRREVENGIHRYELYVDNGNDRRYKEKYKGWTPSIPIADDPKQGYGGMVISEIWQRGKSEYNELD